MNCKQLELSGTFYRPIQIKEGVFNLSLSLSPMGSQRPSSFMKSPSLLIADSHEIARQGYVKILRDWQPQLTLHEASDLDEVRRLIHRHAPDLLITEITLRRQNALEVVEELRSWRTSARPRVLVSTLHHEEKHGLQALQAGASGFVCKGDGVPAFVAAVDAVLGGRMHAREDLILKWRQLSFQGAADLSEREEAILRRLAQGLEAGEISRLLSLSIKTVRDYRQRLMDKLQLHSLADLVRYGMSHGFVDRAF